MNEQLPVDIELLITRHLDGELSGDDVVVLQRWLRDDPANADVFVRRMIDHQRLHELTAVEPMVLASEELERIDEPLGGVHSPNEDSGELLRDLLALEQGQEAAQPVDITQRVLEERLASRRAKAIQHQRRAAYTEQPEGPHTLVIPKSLAWLSVAAVLGLLASVVWLNLPEQTATTTTPPVADRDETPRADSTQPIHVATITGALDARLVDGRTLSPGTPVYNAPFDLAEGIVRLELTSGVTLTLEGPATLDLGSDMFVKLDAGKLVGLVPERAHGFVVRTPTMDIVDLGTEFGIAVDPQQRDSAVHVLDGSVRVEPGQFAQPFTPRVAEAGHAMAVVDQGTPDEVRALPGTFYREVPVSYERLIRDADPLAYWRFSSQEAGGLLAGLGPAQTALTTDVTADLRRDSPLQGDPQGRALWLGAQASTIYAVEPVGLDTQDAFTLEAWVWVPAGTDRRMRILSNNALKPDGRHANGFGLGVSGSEPDRRAGGPVLLFTGYTFFDAFSRVPLPTDRWTHVSVSMDGRGTLRMTIDGRQVPHRVNNDTGLAQHPGYNGELEILPSGEPLRIGHARVQHGGPSEHWTGGIDELAVYGRVLTLDEIAGHAQQDAAPSTRTQRPAR